MNLHIENSFHILVSPTKNGKTRNIQNLILEFLWENMRGIHRSKQIQLNLNRPKYRFELAIVCKGQSWHKV